MRFTALLSVFLIPVLVAADAPQPKPITPAEAAKKVTEKVTVAMLVKSTGGRGNCYLNSEEDFNLATNFTIFISKDVKEKFKKAGIDNPAEYYNKKTIEVTGKVILFEEKPRIPVTEPEQIKVIEKKND